MVKSVAVSKETLNVGNSLRRDRQENGVQQVKLDGSAADPNNRIVDSYYERRITEKSAQSSVQDMSSAYSELFNFCQKWKGN